MLGIATAINPCPLAAGIAAVAFLGRRAASPGRVLLAGVLDALGGSLTYVALAAAVLRGMDAVALAWSLQARRDRSPGPDPHPVGNAPVGTNSAAEAGPKSGRTMAGAGRSLGTAGRPCRWGCCWRWAFVRRRRRSSSAACCGWRPRTTPWLLLPLAYGLGAALPVVLAAGVLAFSARLLGQVFAVTAHVARWGQRVAGTVLIAVGVYFAVRFIFHLF